MLHTTDPHKQGCHRRSVFKDRNQPCHNFTVCFNDRKLMVLLEFANLTLVVCTDCSFGVLEPNKL